jgi:hypothetical protein
MGYERGPCSSHELAIDALIPVGWRWDQSERLGGGGKERKGLGGELAVLSSRLYESEITWTVRDGEIVGDPEDGDVSIGRRLGQAALVREVREGRGSWTKREVCW